MTRKIRIPLGTLFILGLLLFFSSIKAYADEPVVIDQVQVSDTSTVQIAPDPAQIIIVATSQIDTATATISIVSENAIKLTDSSTVVSAINTAQIAIDSATAIVALAQATIDDHVIAQSAVDSATAIVLDKIEIKDAAQSSVDSATATVQIKTQLVDSQTAVVAVDSATVQSTQSTLTTLQNTPSNSTTYTTAGYVAPDTPINVISNSVVLPAMMDAATKIQTPFDIKLGNTLYEGQGNASQIYVTSKATITFGQGDYNYWDFPATPSISVFGSDFMSAGTGGNITVTTTQTTLAISWDLHRFGDSNGPITNVDWTMTVNPTTGEWTGVGTVAGNTTNLYNGPRIGVRETQNGVINSMTNVSSGSLSLEIQTAQTNLSNAQNQLALDQTKLAIIIADKTTSQQDLLTAQQNLTIAIENLTIAQQNLTIANQNLTTADGNLASAVMAIAPVIENMNSNVVAAQQVYNNQAAEEEATRQAAEKVIRDAAIAAQQAIDKAAQDAAIADQIAADQAAKDAAKAEQDRLVAEQKAADALKQAEDKAKQDAEIAAQIAADQAAKDAAKAEADKAKAEQDAKNKAAEDAKVAAQIAADQAAKDAAKAEADKAKAEQDAVIKAQQDLDKAKADKAIENVIGVKPNSPDQLSDTVVKEAPKEVLVAHIQVDKAGVENGGIEFFGTKSAPQVVGEDGKLTPPAPPPGSGLPIPADAITTQDTFIGQPGGTTFNAPDIAVPVLMTYVCETITKDGKEIHIDVNGAEHPVEQCTFLPTALNAIPGAGEAVQAVGAAYTAMANIGNDMSPVTRKKAKKILVLTIAVAAIRRRFGS